MNAAGKAGCGQRSRQEIAVVNGKTDLSVRVSIEVRMCAEEHLGFRGRRSAKTIDIVMAVALGVGEADQRAEREILLHGKSGLAGKVLAGNEMPRTFRAPFRSAGGVDQGFVDALAGFR